MKTILLSIFIIICLGAPSLMANVLVENSLQATAREYAWNSHPDSAAKEVSFSVPGAGFLRITYTDASYNREASDGGLSWRRVPGATNYWKAPGTGIKSLKEPDPPVSGTQLKFTNITRVDGPMHNVGVVLSTPIQGDLVRWWVSVSFRFACSSGMVASGIPTETRRKDH